MKKALVGLAFIFAYLLFFFLGFWFSNNFTLKIETRPKIIAFLILHEGEHKINAINGENKLVESINYLPSYPTCEELDTVVNKKADTILDQVRQNNLAYDKKTNHGKTQEAFFP
jgi:hypothetical protein